MRRCIARFLAPVRLLLLLRCLNLSGSSEHEAGSGGDGGASQQRRYQLEVLSPANNSVHEYNHAGQLEIFCRISTGAQELRYPDGLALFVRINDHGLSPLYVSEFPIHVTNYSLNDVYVITFELLDEFGDLTGETRTIMLAVNPHRTAFPPPSVMQALPMGTPLKQQVGDACKASSERGFVFLSPRENSVLEVFPSRNVSIVIRFLLAAKLMGRCWNGHLLEPGKKFNHTEDGSECTESTSIAMVVKSKNPPERIVELGFEDFVDKKDPESPQPLFLTRDYYAMGLSAGENVVEVKVGQYDTSNRSGPIKSVLNASMSFFIAFKELTSQVPFATPSGAGAGAGAGAVGLIKTFVVNMARHGERWLRTRSLLMQLGFQDFQRWDAFDALKADAHEEMQLSLGEFMTGTGSGWSREAVGCAESHFRLFQHIVTGVMQKEQELCSCSKWQV